jgi:GTP-binding protein
VIYAIARDGRAATRIEDVTVDGATLEPLFDAIREHVPPPEVGEGEGLQLLVSNLDHDEYVGRLALGRVRTGEIRLGDEVVVCSGEATPVPAKISGVYAYDGLSRAAVPSAGAGDIVAVSGLPSVAIGDTLCHPDHPRPLPRIEVDPPTLAMVFRVNDGPLAGRDGKYVTSRHLRDRLFKETYRNVAIQVAETAEPDAFRVAGRGELQLAVLVESMRREGYELTVSNPEPVLEESDGVVREPYELLTCDLPQVSVGRISEILGPRRGRMIEMAPTGADRARVTWRIPARGLIGLRPIFLTETRGEGIMSSRFDGYDEWAGEIVRRTTGALVSDRDGEAVPYGLFSLEDRGVFFIGAGETVYQGMVVGEHSRSNDLDVNVCRTKKLTNIRAAGKDENVSLTPPRQMTLEHAIEWIDSDELVEVTPGTIRLRKRHLDATTRHRMARDKKFAARGDS